MSKNFINLGLIGWPLDHSLSPHIHQAALQELGLCGKYCLYAVEPNNIQNIAIQDLLDHIGSGEITGLNVTLPHKQTVMPFLDSLTPSAARIGAVNTIYLEDSLIIGDNTDAAGFRNDLLQLPVKKDVPVLVLGAGGAARAVVFSLIQMGHPVNIASRNPGKAEKLAASFANIASYPIQVFPLKEETLAKISNEIGLLVNTTPLGMTPHAETCPWPDNLSLPPNACVYDLVYNPVDTLLVRRAREAGLPASSGLGMLVEQAALAFERWTNRAAPRAVMKQAAQIACKTQTSQRIH